ncbi:alpha/beta fold hydrolase [Bryobacter aggregatus]|uniref:alpha/beta fold hydrolase n=1 Tax=Bryobacter aggregatus TaxID=360054 RepID=UPI0004E266FD|nr:alpha/beta hydrolase [Bryobacter aggregatus]
MLRRLFLLLFFGVLCAVAYFSYRYQSTNLETTELNQEERQKLKAPGLYLRTQSGVTHYEIAGPETAQTVVLVHGFSVPYYLWDGTFEALVQAGYRVLRYDLYGRGESDRPFADYNGALFVRQLAELLARLQISSKVDLIGASMGGPILADYAVQHPDRVNSLTLIGPGYSHGGRLPWQLRTPVIGEYLFATQITPNLPRAQLSDFVDPGKFPDWSERYKAQMRYRGFRRALLSTLRHYATADWVQSYTAVGKMKIPVFLIWGKADRDVPFRYRVELRKEMPQAEFLALEKSAHVPFLEEPEITRPAMIRFLAAHPNRPL